MQSFQERHENFSGNRHGLLLWLAKQLFGWLLLAGVLFGASGSVNWPQAWGYLGLVGILQVINGLILWRVSPSLLVERSRIQSGAKRWDIWMAMVMAWGVDLIGLCAGLDFRWNGAGQVQVGWYVFALLLTLVSFGFLTWAMLENRFFSGLVRIQTEHGHTVIDHGPYGWIRHPGYSSAILTYLMAPILLGSGWAFFAALGVMGVTVLRTAREDLTLKAELTGYLDYSRRVRYRLLPGIW